MLRQSENDQTKPWYALQCKPNFEFVVADQLDTKRLECYLPLLNAKPKNPRSRTTIPFFPGYLFVNGRQDQLYAKRIGLMRGVVGLVSFDGMPASIPVSVIELVRKHVLTANQRQATLKDELQNGDRVWVDDPILQGVEAHFERCLNGKERVEVLLTLLGGRMLRLDVPASMVKLAR